jgi:TATA-box binding protein (TBP) (component of TFIID and TFIIIB)
MSKTSPKVNWNKFEFEDYINVKEDEITDLPHNLKISTMCATGVLKSLINITNIEKFLELDYDDVITVKIDDDRNRTLIDKKKTKKLEKVVEKKKTNHFYNQITVVIRVNHQIPVIDWKIEPKINFKLFKNGSVQMSGCKSLRNINIALNKLIYKLKIIKSKIEDNKIVEKPFVEDVNTLGVDKFKIDMINTNYQVNIQIDRTKLFLLLFKKNIKVTFEPCARACVIVKYTPPQDNVEQKEISIFIFQKGNIIITGARRRSHIICAYEYINNILLTHTDEIIKNDEKVEQELIFSIYGDIIKDVENGLLNISTN